MHRIAIVLLLVATAAISCQKETAKSGPAESGGEASAEAKPAGPSKVDGAKARELVSSGAILLDVRTQGEFDGGHIEGAKHLPVQELAGRMEEVGAKDKAVVIYCASGRRSARAATMLAEAGWTDVYDLGGMGNW